MRSSLPRENEFSSSHSSRELMVRKSSTVICALRASGFSNGCLSWKKSSTRVSTPDSSPRSMAMPTSMPVMVLVAERVLRKPSAPSASK